MNSVIDLAAFREERAQAEGCLRTRPPDGLIEDQIRLQHQPDGSYRAKITGIYAEDPSAAIEAMVDATTRLGSADPLLAVQLMANAIGHLTFSARQAENSG